MNRPPDAKMAFWSTYPQWAIKVEGRAPLTLNLEELHAVLDAIARTPHPSAPKNPIGVKAEVYQLDGP